MINDAAQQPEWRIWWRTLDTGICPAQKTLEQCIEELIELTSPFFNKCGICGLSHYPGRYHNAKDMVEGWAECHYRSELEELTRLYKVEKALLSGAVSVAQGDPAQVIHDLRRELKAAYEDLEEMHKKLVGASI